jgi:tetratricopeptide (TPR) repeat protein
MVTSKSSLPVAALALAILLQGCAGNIATPRPEQIPALEAQLQKKPDDKDVAAQLGAAYVAAKRYDDAKRVLTPLVSAGTSNASAYVYLGVASEETNDFTGARAAYQKYLEVGRDQSVKDDIEGRLALVARKELKQQARAILDREQILSTEAPTPRTLAVMPFQFIGASEELKPLQTALADMMITDLSVSRSLIPVERVRMQALIDEMLLGQAGISDAANTTRAGRLLKAEHIVQGAINVSADRQLRVEGNVLATASRASRGSLTGQNSVDAVFDLEKQLVFDIYRTLGITLTVAEQERINDNRTGNLLAFLAYGRGLEALDRGNYGEASAFFNQATSLDPQFSRAQAQRTEATQLNQSAQTSAEQIASSAATEAASMEVVAPTVSTGDMLKNTASEVNYSPATQMTTQASSQSATQTQQTRNNGAQEAQGGSSGGVQQALKATITINIKRPGA